MVYHLFNASFIGGLCPANVHLFEQRIQVLPHIFIIDPEKTILQSSIVKQ